MKYEARRGFHVTDEDADRIGRFVDKLPDRTATVFLQHVARTVETSPLRKLFLWNDTLAAHKYRLDQARYYLRCYSVVDIKEKERVKAMYAIRYEEEPAERTYEPFKKVIASAEMTAQKSEEYYQELLAICKKADDLDMNSDPAWAVIIKAVRENKPEL